MCLPVIDVLNKGGVICYASVSGGLMLLDKDRKETETQPSISDFLTMRENKTIVHFDTMRQGHHIFHGRVDFYKVEK